MKKIILLLAITGIFSISAIAQLTLPSESQRQEIVQNVGDTKVSIIYHRPNIKARKVWGGLVPYGEVWRTGANNATVFEVSNDVTIGGQKLPKGKYSLYTIPTESDWTIIFNKTWDQWGTVYDAKLDAIRVTAKPMPAEFRETMSFEIDNVTGKTAEVAIRWEKVAVPFTVDIGDVSARLLNDTRRKMVNEPVQMANYVLNQKMTANYEEALGWVEGSIKIREAFGNLRSKALLLAEMGRTADAIAAGEKAVAVGKAATPAINNPAFEKTLAEWKTKK
ncbi:MAG: DUF2911 domain-containing protein [Saprospiraceae bacterium]|nr:DUF2911 domain-containing protein [Pyrinomonadaceae bacterium]